MQRPFLYLQYLFFRLLVFIVNSLSVLTATRLAETIGSLLFLRERRRQFCLHNLRHAFPKKSEAEIKRIGRASLQGLVKIVFEFIRIPTISKNVGGHIEMRGEGHVWEALRGGKGVIFAVSHFGNWELAGIAASFRGFPLHAVGRPHKNPFISNFIKRLRGWTGLQTIDKRGAVQECVRLLKRNQIIAMLIDEHAKKGEVWVDFFGEKAATSALPAMLALKYKAPVIPAFFYRERNRRSVLAFGRPFPLKQTGSYESDVQANTQQYMRYLEEELIRRPEDWTLWMHNRWRWHDLPGRAGTVNP